MLSAAAIVAGIVLVALALTDVYVTVIAAAEGGGPVTRRVSRGLWRAGRKIPVGDVHRRLSATGHLILIAVIVGWLLLIWGGFAVLFLSDPASVVNSSTQEPASVAAKLAFAAGGLAGAGAGFVAGSGGWEAINNLAAILGLSWATLTLTYLFQVVTAASRRRALAVRILGIADDPVSMAALGSGEEELGQLGQHLTSIAHEVALVARYHQALPTLPYFHVGERRAAIEVAVAVLDEALTLLEAGDEASCTIVRPARVAIGEFLRTAGETRVAREPDLPRYDDLRLADLQLDESALRRRGDELTHRRRALCALVEQQGWDWNTDVLGAGTTG